MKPMICQMCNGNDLVYKDGIYVCQHCGTKYEIEENKKYCKHCGQLIAEKAVICPKCGCQVEEIKADNTGVHVENTTVQSNFVAPVQYAVSSTSGTPKNKWISVILCIAFGFLGAHKFYEGKMGLGVVYLFTCGLFFIGVIVDLIVLLGKPEEYYVK